MKIKLKILEPLVLVAFLAGQVQFGRTTYFCTQQLKTVTRPSAVMQSSQMNYGDDTCDECQGFIPRYNGQELSSPSCIQVHTFQKNSVGSFTEAKVANYDQASALLGGLYQKLPLLLVRRNVALIPCDASPPLDLSIANCTLRI